MNQPSSPHQPDSGQFDSSQFDSGNPGGKDPGIVREFAGFLRYNKKWWLTPILVVTVLMIAMAFLAASPATPFIYALF
ncbi:hypothetical protein K227x_44220 [Rubripirellula lacrimiformis]|uniref:Uncharacterized protein n=1 Tax=Rubripirellula lacrimiformis TaxID=1930273 RepID=A0A517NFW8_9BACT|nr:DUF5989 family protein [Rubripirellula lacrimiformis]QDT06015.1 hypothetical protein K227x_44220 [Rubripirellula lacrimiformis]